MVKKTLAMLIFLSTVAIPASAQMGVSGSVWVDLFLGPDGDVIYPQYAFAVDTRVGNATGYGFLERAPGEPLFTNHVNTFVPSLLASKLAVRTEIGGATAQSVYFFQVGPQVQLHEVVLPLKKVMGYLILSYLPNLAGRRPSNTIFAGGTRHFKITDSVEVSFEGYRRFFSKGGADYSEYWVLVYPARTKHVSFGGFLLQDGGEKSLALGVRISD